MGVVPEYNPPKSPQPGEKVTSWGHTFTWTPLHKNGDQLNEMVYTYDKVGTDCIDRLLEIAPPNKETPYASRDLFKLVKDNATQDPAVKALWDEVNTVPDWVDWEQIDRGQKTFWRYVGPALVTLGQLSLLGSFAYGRAVKVLSKTGGWKTENIMRRLLETSQHTLDVHRDLKSLQPGGQGWESSVRVRLLHSSVRRRIINLAEEKPEYYDREADGVPINDMDSIITMNDFSSLVMFLGLPRQGIHAKPQEIADYLAVWRYICYIMGTPNWFLASPEQGKAMMESILTYEVKPDPATSGLISNNMINGMVGQKPSYSSRGFLCASAYWMNGREVASALQIEEPGLYHKALVAGQCWIFMMSTTIRRTLLPFADNAINEVSKKKIYDAVVHNKEKGALGYKAKFTFKWIPSLEFMTQPGATPADLVAGSGAFRHFSIETLSLLTLVMTTASTIGSIWYGARLARNLDLAPVLTRFPALTQLPSLASLQTLIKS